MYACRSIRVYECVKACGNLKRAHVLVLVCVTVCLCVHLSMCVHNRVFVHLFVFVVMPVSYVQNVSTEQLSWTGGRPSNSFT